MAAANHNERACRLSILPFLVAVLASSPSGAIEQCRFIGPKAEREACYQRQAVELEAKRKRNATVSTTPSGPAVDKLENDRLNARLKSICRGC